MIVEFDEYKGKLTGLKPVLTTLEAALKLDDAKEEIAHLEQESAADGFWNDLANSQRVLQKIKQLKHKCEQYDSLLRRYDDLLTLCQMAAEEEDESLLPELEEEYASFENDLEQARLSTLLSGEYDNSNAILTFHAGAGGTEAQDWTQMLVRMYTHWACLLYTSRCV